MLIRPQVRLAGGERIVLRFVFSRRGAVVEILETFPLLVSLTMLKSRGETPESLQPNSRISASQIKMFAMQLRIGYELIYSFPQPTPIILVVNIHDSRASDIVVPDRLTTEPSIPITGYRDAFGNRCHRVLAPAGRLRLTADGGHQR